jgi:hypothetical protein
MCVSFESTTIALRILAVKSHRERVKVAAHRFRAQVRLASRAAEKCQARRVFFGAFILDNYFTQRRVRDKADKAIIIRDYRGNITARENH